MSTPSKAREHLGTRDGAEAAFHIGDHKARNSPRPASGNSRTRLNSCP
jgi:hypothetical protein